MYVEVYWLFVAFLVIFCNGDLSDTDIQSMEFSLLAVRNKIIEVDAPFFTTKEAFKEEKLAFWYDHYKNFTDGIPIMVIDESTVGTQYFGNRFAKYLHDFSCAYNSGAHIIHRSFKVIPFRSKDVTDSWLFSAHIPPVVVNPRPASSMQESIERMPEICQVSDYPWNTEDDILSFVPAIRLIMLPALAAVVAALPSRTTLRGTEDAELLMASEYQQYMSGDLDTYDMDYYSSNTAEYLHSSTFNSEAADPPMYPDVVVHYRCSDNVFFPGMGLSQFGAIITRIPPNSKTIYILTDSHYQHSVSGIPFEWHLCEPVLRALHQDIAEQFPLAHVVTRVGGSIFSAMAMIAHSKTVFCSVSTFCFNAALCNSEGNVYFTKSTMLYGKRGMDINCCGNPYSNFHTMLDTFPLWELPKNITVDRLIAILRSDNTQNEMQLELELELSV